MGVTWYVILGLVSALLLYAGWLMCIPICIDPEKWRLRCKLGFHPSEYGSWESETHMGMGVFGGPIFTYRWRCRRCGGRCSQ